MKLLFEEKISGRMFLATNAKNITDYLRHLEKDLNDRLTEMKVVPLNHFYDLLELPRIPYGDDIGWVFNPWIRVRISASSVNLNEGSLPKFTLHFDPEPAPWETVANPYNVSIPRRNGKTLCAEAMKHIREEYLEKRSGDIEEKLKAMKEVFGCTTMREDLLTAIANRKENNMTSKSDIPCILIGKKGDPRGVHTIELKIKNVIFNEPATIVFWSDGTKTVVKAGPNDAFDPEKGLAMAISKKMLGNNYKAYGRFKKWLPKEYGEKPLPEKIGSGSVPWNQLTKENKDNATSEK